MEKRKKRGDGADPTEHGTGEVEMPLQGGPVLGSWSLAFRAPYGPVPACGCLPIVFFHILVIIHLWPI